MAKSDGSVDIWDLLDRTHEPSLTQTISAAPVTSIFPKQVRGRFDKDRNAAETAAAMVAGDWGEAKIEREIRRQNLKDRQISGKKER